MSKDCHTADRLLCPVLYTCHQASRQKDYDSLRDMSIRFLIKHIRPDLALASWLDARLIPDGTTCITIKSHRGKHILSQSFSDYYERTLLKFAGCHLRAQSPTGFPIIRRACALRTLAILLQASHAVVALIFKISPHQSLIAFLGVDSKEEVGFEPTRQIII